MTATGVEGLSQDLQGRVPEGKYLVSPEGEIKYLIDPGINGVLKERDDGTKVQKYEAPKARLMSLIIDGILTQKLPWGLVLLGVSIALVMELCGVPALAFAVGVYLPLSASTPIFFGGMVRYFVQKLSKKKEEESESSPGILVSSGLIAGGSIAGIGLAILSIYEGLGSVLDMSARFPAFTSNHLVATIAFAIMCVWLMLVGMGKLLKEK
jgi:hypothetical protein